MILITKYRSFDQEAYQPSSNFPDISYRFQNVSWFCSSYGLFAPTDSTKRKTLEKRIIFKLGTLYPTGLNKQFTYLQ